MKIAGKKRNNKLNQIQIRLLITNLGFWRNYLLRKVLCGVLLLIKYAVNK